MRRITAKVIFFMLAFWLMVGCADKEEKQLPNIIFILADDLGYHDIGALSDGLVKTPNIDRIAAEGVRLTNFYVTGAVCTPTRGSFLTGRYPQRNGLFHLIRNNEINYGHRFTDYEYAVSPEMTIGLDVREITIAEQLKKAGYTTGIVGKWDSGRARRFLPKQRGFDFFYGFCNTGIDYWTHERYEVPSLFSGNEQIKEAGYATTLFRREALAFIDEHHAAPFFLYAAFNAPHVASNLDKDPFQAPDEYLQMYGEPPYDNKKEYNAMITCMDEAIGAMIGKLKEYGIEDNTLVVVASDNGPGGIGENGPLKGKKGKMYEGGIRVFFTAKWPGVIPKGSVSNEFCSILDLFPTFQGIAGVDKPAGLILDGYDILPVLTGASGSQRNEHYWEWHGKRAVRSGNWKWVRETSAIYADAEDETGELYDLSIDIGEQQNLAEEFPEVLKDMQAKWEAWKQEMEDAVPRGPFRNY